MKDFDKLFDLEGLKKDIDEVQNNSGYEDVPFGDYEVKIEKIELTESKKGDPMVSIWFRVVAGDFKNSMIFYNKLVNDGKPIYFNNLFLKSLNSGLDIKFNTYADYAQLLSDIYVAVDGTYEYLLSYGQNSKGYNTYEIKDVFTLTQN